MLNGVHNGSLLLGFVVWVNEIRNARDVTFNKYSVCISHYTHGRKKIIKL